MLISVTARLYVVVVRMSRLLRSVIVGSWISRPWNMSINKKQLR